MVFIKSLEGRGARAAGGSRDWVEGGVVVM